MEVLDARGRERVQTVNDGPSLTVQSDAADADIQEILGKYRQFGLMRSLDGAEGQFMDLTEFTDYADAMRNLRSAEAYFKMLPSKVREVFDHDVAKFLDSAHDPDKRDLLVQAGFISEKPPVEVSEAPVEPVSAADDSSE